MMDSKPSLNGGKARPLTAVARAVLADLAQAPRPTSTINPGVIDRLTRGGLVTLNQLPSPYKAHKGGTCPHAVITDAGRKEAAPGS